MNDVYFRGSNKYYKSKMERMLDFEEEMDQQQLQQEQEEHRH